jgi:hypothetical protein
MRVCGRGYGPAFPLAAGDGVAEQPKKSTPAERVKPTPVHSFCVGIHFKDALSVEQAELAARRALARGLVVLYAEGKVQEIDAGRLGHDRPSFLRLPRDASRYDIYYLGVARDAAGELVGHRLEANRQAIDDWAEGLPADVRVVVTVIPLVRKSK